jgi:EamA domain-containing membrane protein RarD
MNPREDSLSKGIALSVSASVLFAVMYYYTSLLTPLSGVEIFGWRMLLTVPCMTVFMIVSGEWRRVWSCCGCWRQAKADRRRGAIFGLARRAAVAVHVGAANGRSLMCRWATSCCR